jgi:hypothetical protein
MLLRSASGLGSLEARRRRGPSSRTLSWADSDAQPPGTGEAAGIRMTWADAAVEAPCEERAHAVCCYSSAAEARLPPMAADPRGSRAMGSRATCCIDMIHRHDSMHMIDIAMLLCT